MMTSTSSSFNSVLSEAGQSTLSMKLSTSSMTMTNMMPKNTIFVTPTKSTWSYTTATTSPPVPPKKPTRLSAGNKDDEEEFESSIPYFPSLLDVDDMCDDTPDTPRRFFSESMDKQDTMYCTPTQAFISPLSVEKFAIPRIRLKRRLSGNAYDYNTTDSPNTQDLLPLLLVPQLFDEDIANPIQLSFRNTSENLTALKALNHACDAYS